MSKDTAKKVTIGVILGATVTALSLYLLTRRDDNDLLTDPSVLDAIEAAKDDVKAKVIDALENDFTVARTFINVKPEVTRLAENVLSFAHPKMS